jgi:hypothetical protein
MYADRWINYEHVLPPGCPNNFSGTNGAVTIPPPSAQDLAAGDPLASSVRAHASGVLIGYARLSTAGRY